MGQMRGPPGMFGGNDQQDEQADWAARMDAEWRRAEPPQRYFVTSGAVDFLNPTVADRRWSPTS